MQKRADELDLPRCNVLTAAMPSLTVALDGSPSGMKRECGGGHQS